MKLYESNAAAGEKKQRMASYQRYFQGYTEAKVTKKNGKGFKVVRIYTDPYHLHDMEDGAWCRRKLAYAGLTLLSIALYLFAAIAGVRGNTAAFVVVLGCLSACMLVFLLTAAIFYISCPRKMTVYDCQRSNLHMRIWSLAAAVCLACTALASLVYILFFARTQLPLELACCLAYALSAAAAWRMNRLENRTEYREEHNDAVIPFDPEADYL